MSDRRSTEWYGPDPGHDGGHGPAIEQSGQDEEPVVTPEDVRNTLDVPEPPGGPYPPHSAIERPHAIPAPTTIPIQPTRDPSLSRAVDRAASGLAPEDAGYDRSNDGPAPGPLDPPVGEERPDSVEHPGGQWGSSGG
jgi:hypothetical protein